MLLKPAALVSLILVAGFAFGDLAGDAAAAGTEAEFKQALVDNKTDPAAKSLLRNYKPGDWQSNKSRIADRSRIQALVNGEAGTAPNSGTATSTTSAPAKEAKKIVDSPLYRDSEAVESKSWLDDAIKRLGEWLEGLFNAPQGPNVQVPTLPFLQQIVWTLLILAVAAFLFFVAKQLWESKRRKIARASGVLDEDEPLLPADEWLDKAAALKAEGRFREAVRCLYLACLMRLDEAGQLRFNRHHTNWEHLHRLVDRSGPGRGVMREATQLFDNTWYGHLTATSENVDQMQAHYKSVVEEIKMARSMA